MGKIVVVEDSEALAVLMERIHKYVLAYNRQTKLPVKLGMLGQQFGRAALRLGTSVRDILERPEQEARYYTNYAPKGALLLYSREFE